MSASNAIMSFTAPFRCLVSKFVFIASNTHCMVTFRCAGQRSITLSGCRKNLVLKKINLVVSMAKGAYPYKYTRVICQRGRFQF